MSLTFSSDKSCCFKTKKGLTLFRLQQTDSTCNLGINLTTTFTTTPASTRCNKRKWSRRGDCEINLIRMIIADAAKNLIYNLLIKSDMLERRQERGRIFLLWGFAATKQPETGCRKFLNRSLKIEKNVRLKMFSRSVDVVVGLGEGRK